MFKFAARNILSKPARAIFTILAIVVAVAMIFSMLSIKDAIYNYIFETETSSSGNSDIVISTNSSSDRITTINQQLIDMDNIKDIIPSFTIYATFGDEYVKVRGFQSSDIDALSDINVLDGSIDRLKDGINFDNVIISKDASEHFNLKVGSSVQLKIGTRNASFIVCAISDKTGYFLNDSPYQFISSIKQVSKLISTTEIDDLYNELYIKVNDSSKIDETIDAISSIPTYSSLVVERSKNIDYIDSRVEGITAPVVLTGAAVLLLCVAIIFILFMSTEAEKVDYISRLKIIGATKKQIILIFLLETVLLALVGIVLGAGVGIGIYAGLVKIILSKSIAFSISVGYLFLALFIAFVVSILSSLLPIFRSFNSSIRENIVGKKPESKKGIIILLLLIILVIISVVLESTINTITGQMAIVSLVLTLMLVAFGVPYVLKVLANGLKKSSIPEIRFSALSIIRDKRFSRSVVMLTMGMLIAMLLFMTWGLTNDMFTTYANDFADMIFIKNIQSTVDVGDFANVEGVKDVTKLVWTQGSVECKDFSKSMHMFGTKDVIRLVDFEYITNKDTVINKLEDISTPYVIADISIHELYGTNVGDVLSVTLDGVKKDVIIGGFVKSRLFTGNYLIMNNENVQSTFGLEEDTVLVVSNDNIDKTVENLRIKFSSKNYYVIKTLDAYQWEMNSLNSVFDLIGALAFIVAILTFIIIVSTTLISRGTINKEINAFLNAGMSKSSMLKKELYEHTIVAFVSCIISTLSSVLLTYIIIDALRLFGMYYSFMFEALAIVLTGIIMGILYILLPVALNFKKSYNISKLKV